jgi:Domain of Unknown Function (DUF1206)
MARFGSLLVLVAMRAGYAARGVVYLTVGILALAASAGGGPAPGLVGAVRRLGDMPWHRPILFALALGLMLYAVWRGLDAIVDLAGHGRGFGLVERFGLFIVALLHVLFAWYALRLGLGGPYAPGGGGRVAGLVAALIRHPPGRWFVVLVGVGTVSFGAYSVWQGARSGYRTHLRPSRLVERAAPLLAFGLIARGAVFWVMGGFIVWAGWNFEPRAAGGFGDALERIRGVAYGRALLGLVGAGLVAFAIFCFVEAAYRVLPLHDAKAARPGRTR